MKKIFTLISMALVAMSVNAQATKEDMQKLIEEGKLYEAAEITMGDIKWELKNKRIINDAAGTVFYPIVGTGNAYEAIYAEETENNMTGETEYRPFYTYTDYAGGETGLPKYGLYYKFTPSVAGKVRMKVWINKGSRKTVIVPQSTGKPLVYHSDYDFEGYVNGQNKATTTPVIDPETGSQKLDNDGNPVWVMEDIFFSADEMYERWVAAGEKQWVVDAGNQNVWGWFTFNVAAGESYYVFQLSSQLGFSGYDFTPEGGSKEEYVASSGETKADMNTDFSSIIDDSFVATNVGTTGRSVVKFSTANMKVEAVGSAVPSAVVPGAKIEATGINNVKGQAEIESDAPIFNIAGQRVAATSKGIIILNGKKVVNK